MPSGDSMSNDTIKTRIQLKNDTEENWNKAINFVPRKGELIIYNAESGQNIDTARLFPRFKVGDGVTTVVNLPFFYGIGQYTYEDIAPVQIINLCPST